PGQPRPVDVGEVVQGLEPLLRRVLPPSVDLQVEGARALWLTQADPGQLEQVLLNLALNARDAMPRGGPLRLSLRNVHLDQTQAQRVAGLRAGDYVSIQVADAGEGIRPEIKARLFEPFFSTKAEGQGTGLGLTVVYGIVSAAGGGIAVESTPGRGATFTVYLPRVEAGPRGRCPRGPA
ncbi:MAG: ATP-binding protein, partial [Actinobacteria bacterium]|nr:ATP-binding protein [Actinomycetota bacterium]